MARIKYFDTMANAWRYADSMVLAAPVVSVNGQTGAVVLTAEDLGAESAGTVAVHADSASAHADIRTLVAGAMMKADYSIKKAKLTLEDGSSILIDVVVASQGEAVSDYTNRVPLSIDTDGSIFNGVGYINGTRLSSSGVTKAETAASATGYIPAKGADVIRISGCNWYNLPNGGANYLCAYDSSFTYIGAVIPGGDGNGYVYNTAIHTAISGNDTLAVITLAALSNIAYIRVSCKDQTGLTEGPGAGMIVTVNEEIKM